MVIWNTRLAAERVRAKKLRPAAVEKKLIKKYHDAWARANGYKPQAASCKPQAASKKQLDSHKIPDIK